MAKAAAAAGVATGQCLCGKVTFEIDVPARWAWHDHSAASRRAHGAAYATYVGSWKKRFRVTAGKTALTRYEDKATKTARSFCAHCGTPIAYCWRHTYPCRLTATSSLDESAFTTETPTPCRPPETA